MTDGHDSMTTSRIDLCRVTEVASGLSHHVDFVYHKTPKLTPGLLQAWAEATMPTGLDTIPLSKNDFLRYCTEMQQLPTHYFVFQGKSRGAAGGKGSPYHC